MLKKFLRWIKSLFRSTTTQPYVVVERQTEDGGYRQGILLQTEQFNGIVVTTSPKVGVKLVDDVLQLTFDLAVEANPNNIQYDYSTLHEHVGDILLELIQRDYATGRNNSISTDQGH
jgi:hypothetical protein